MDTSALLAVLKDESDAELYMEALATAEAPKVSAGTLLEAAIVTDARQDPILSARLDQLVAESGLRVVDVTATQAALARLAYRDYGKGRGHPAGLNFGDCFAYALAKETGEPLLFKGDDFSQTDLTPAL